jgi:hypothetical protein
VSPPLQHRLPANRQRCWRLHHRLSQLSSHLRRLPEGNIASRPAPSSVAAQVTTRPPGSRRVARPKSQSRQDRVRADHRAGSRFALFFEHLRHKYREALSSRSSHAVKAAPFQNLSGDGKRTAAMALSRPTRPMFRQIVADEGIEILATPFIPKIGKDSRIKDENANVYSTGGFTADREFQPRQVSPTASAIPASRDSKPPLVWPRAPLLA